MAEYVSRDDVRRFIADAFSENRFATNYDYAILVDKIDEIPAADAQPIRCGRWIGINEYCKKNGYIPSGMGIYYWCSECGKEEPKISDYCPNCGARMDGDTNG